MFSHEIIYELLAKNKKEVKELAAYVGVVPSVISGWKSGYLKAPSVDKVEKVADFFGVSVDFLLGRDCQNMNFALDNTTPTTYNSGIKNIPAALNQTIHAYNELDEHGKRIVDLVLNEELTRVKAFPREEYAAEIYTISHYEFPVSAGLGEYIQNDDYKTLRLKKEPPKGSSFTVSVSGDSMEPFVKDGDIIFVKQQSAIDIGQIGVFYYEGNTYVKKLGEGCLVSYNPAYEPITINMDSLDSFECYGLMLGVCTEDYLL